MTEPLGGVRNLRVTDPTTSSLDVQWEAAEGNVRQYKVFYVPAAGGETLMVVLQASKKRAGKHDGPLFVDRTILTCR